jgi:ribosomal protein S2
MHRAVLMVALATLACGCSYSMHEYQAAGYAPATPTSGGAPRQAVWIHARANQGVILGVTDNTDYVDEAYQRLLAQCPGDIVAVNTRYSTKLGFLSYRNTVEMQAFCLE